MRRSIRWQIVGLVGVMLIAAIATYLVLASSVLASDKLSSLKDVTHLLSLTAAQQVEASIEALSDKLRYFGRVRPEPATLFDPVDGVYTLRVFSRAGDLWSETYSWVAPNAP